MNIPLVFVAYRRPQYFQRCLISLKAQTVQPEGRAYLFLDGPEDDLGVRACRELFQEYYPTGLVHGGPHIGSNANFYRATFWPFMRLDTEMIWLVEEDLELLPRYYEQLLVLVNLLKDNPEVGTVSAWGCGTRGWKPEDVVAHKDTLIEAHNHCGSVIFRRAFAVLNQNRMLLEQVLCDNLADRPARLKILNQTYPLARKPNGDFTVGGGWDEIYQLLVRRNGLFAVSTAFRLLRHIGEFGKNSSPQSWLRDWSEQVMPTHDLFTASPVFERKRFMNQRLWAHPEIPS